MKPGRRFVSENVKQQVLAMTDQGFGPTKISAQLGISRSMVYDIRLRRKYPGLTRQEAMAAHKDQLGKVEPMPFYKLVEF